MPSKTIIKALGKRINVLRQEKGMSLQQMALACDMDKAQIYKICSEGVDIRFSTLAKISEGLEMSISEICKGSILINLLNPYVISFLHIEDLITLERFCWYCEERFQGLKQNRIGACVLRLRGYKCLLIQSEQTGLH